MLTGNWLSRFCADLEKQYSVEISDYAREFILQSAVAVQFDPHPDWIRNGVRTLEADTLQAFIVDQMTALVRSGPVQRSGVVTYFHVLHWLMDNAVALKGFPVPKDP